MLDGGPAELVVELDCLVRGRAIFVLRRLGPDPEVHLRSAGAPASPWYRCAGFGSQGRELRVCLREGRRALAREGGAASRAGARRGVRTSQSSFEGLLTGSLTYVLSTMYESPVCILPYFDFGQSFTRNCSILHTCRPALMPASSHWGSPFAAASLHFFSMSEPKLAS